MKVGDHWVYHSVDGYRAKTEWDETHEVMAIDANGITMRITRKGLGIDTQRIERWSAPGVVVEGAVFENETDRFEPALVRYKYPLTTGESWNQHIRDALKPPGPYGPIVRWVSVDGYEAITTPASGTGSKRKGRPSRRPPRTSQTITLPSLEPV